MGKGVPIPPLQRPRYFQRDKCRQKEEDDNTYYLDIEKTRMPLLEEMESEWDFGGEVWHAGGWAGVLILNKLVRDYQFLFSSSSFSSLSPLLFLSSLRPPAFLIIMMYFQGQSQQWAWSRVESSGAGLLRIHEYRIQILWDPHSANV